MRAALCVSLLLFTCSPALGADNLGDARFPEPGVTTISQTISDADLEDDMRRLVEANEQPPYRLKYAEIAGASFRVRAIRVESDYCRPPYCSTYYIFDDNTAQRVIGAVNFASAPSIQIPEESQDNPKDAAFAQIEVETQDARLRITASATALFVRKSE